jgi:hypothetical protein
MPSWGRMLLGALLAFLSLGMRLVRMKACVTAQQTGCLWALMSAAAMAAESDTATGVVSGPEMGVEKAAMSREWVRPGSTVARTEAGRESLSVQPRECLSARPTALGTALPSRCPAKQETCSVQGTGREMAAAWGIGRGWRTVSTSEPLQSIVQSITAAAQNTTKGMG